MKVFNEKEEELICFILEKKQNCCSKTNLKRRQKEAINLYKNGDGKSILFKAICQTNTDAKGR